MILASVSTVDARLTVLRLHRFDIQNHDSDVANCQGVRKQCSYARGTCCQLLSAALTSRDQHNLFSPVCPFWPQQPAGLVVV